MPSTVTLPSSITSSSADCVFEEVRLISAARKRFVSAAPLLYSNSPVFLLSAIKPVRSEGSTSGVNCTRLYSSDSAFESASARVVLPTPGMSSISTWPPASTESSTFIIMSSLPMITFFISRITRWHISSTCFCSSDNSFCIILFSLPLKNSAYILIIT